MEDLAGDRAGAGVRAKPDAAAEAAPRRGGAAVLGEALVERVREALPPFESFLEANRTTVFRYLVAAVGREHADDVFQETFLAALRAYPRCTEAAELMGCSPETVRANAYQGLKSLRGQKGQKGLM